jgi:hypothetical protein
LDCIVKDNVLGSATAENYYIVFVCAVDVCVSLQTHRFVKDNGGAVGNLSVGEAVLTPKN